MFMDTDFTYAVEISTKASWMGSLYMVELFEDGSYRVFRNDSADTDTQQQICSLIIDVPTFKPEDYSAEVHEIEKNDFIGDELIDLVKFDSLYAIEDSFLDRVYERISNASN
jgi:hypothetical protein